MSLAADVQFLAAVEPFRRFDQEAVRLIAFDAERLILKAGDILFRQHTACDAIYVVLSGTIALDSPGTGGQNPRIVMSGAVIGAASTIAATAHAVQAVAREASTVYRVPRNLLLRVLEAYPACAVRWRDMMSERLAQQTTAFAAIGTALEG